MAVNIHITIIELNALHTKRQNLFQELDAVIHLLMEAKHWGLRKSRNATSLNSRFKSLDTLKVKIISVTFRRVIRTNHKKASKIWRHENIQLDQQGSQDGKGHAAYARRQFEYRHNLSSSKGPKPLQLKLLTTYIPKTSAFTLAFSTSQRLRTTRASARTFFTFRHYITPSARNF